MERDSKSSIINSLQSTKYDLSNLKVREKLSLDLLQIANYQINLFSRSPPW